MTIARSITRGLTRSISYGLTDGPWGEYDKDAALFFRRASPMMSKSVQDHVNALVVDLKAANVWDKRDAYYLHCLERQQNALLNLKGESYTAVAVNSPTFVAGKGFLFNGTSSYLNTGFNPSTVDGMFTKDSASLGFSTFQISSGNVRAGNNTARIGKTGAAPLAYSRANDATTQDTSVSSLGHYIWSRGSSAAYERSVDGVALADVAVASTAVTNAPIHIGRADTLYGAHGVSSFAIGGHLTAAERHAEQAAFRSFLLRMGAEGYTVGLTSQSLAGRTFNVQSANQSWSVQRAAFRPSLFRFETRQGDFWSGDTENDRTRAELQCTTKEAFGTETWVSFAVKMLAPAGIQSESLVIGQFHATEDAGDFSGYPAFELNLTASGLNVYTASVAAASQASAYPRTARAQNVPFSLGVWHNIVVRVVFDYSGAAELDVYLDGDSIVNISGVSIGMNDVVGPYWKHGQYWAPETAEQTIVSYFDNLEVGTSSLLSRVATPLAVVDW